MGRLVRLRQLTGRSPRRVSARASSPSTSRATSSRHSLSTGAAWRCTSSTGTASSNGARSTMSPPPPAVGRRCFAPAGSHPVTGCSCSSVRRLRGRPSSSARSRPASWSSRASSLHRPPTWSSCCEGPAPGSSWSTAPMPRTWRESTRRHGGRRGRGDDIGASRPRADAIDARDDLRRPGPGLLRSGWRLGRRDGESWRDRRAVAPGNSPRARLRRPTTPSWRARDRLAGIGLERLLRPWSAGAEVVIADAGTDPRSASI